MKLRDLIETLGGELLAGDPDLELTGVSDTADAGDTELVFGETAGAALTAAKSGAGAAVVARDLSRESIGLAESSGVQADGVEASGIAIIAVAQPRLWFARAARLMKSAPESTGIHSTAVIGEEVKLGDGVWIGASAVVGAGVSIGDRSRVEAGAVLGDAVRVGEDCHIHPRAVLYPGVILGNRVIIHSGAILGADGFGYVRDDTSGSYTQFPQQGQLILEDDVEVGANTTIDRGALGVTRIRRGVKLDNLVHVGHNCDIGEDVVIAALTGISGSSSIGKGAVIAGQVGIGDHAHVGPGVILGGQAGVLSGKTVKAPGQILWGTPARPLREYLRELATLAKLSRRPGKDQPGDRASGPAK